jgi:hypothetical protein
MFRVLFNSMFALTANGLVFLLKAKSELEKWFIIRISRSVCSAIKSKSKTE